MSDNATNASKAIKAGLLVFSAALGGSHAEAVTAGHTCGRLASASGMTVGDLIGVVKPQIARARVAGDNAARAAAAAFDAMLAGFDGVPASAHGDVWAVRS